MNSYTQEDFVKIFENVVKYNIRHEYYQHVVNLAEWCMDVMEGRNNEYLIKFRMLEDKAQQEQRHRITHSRTQYISSKIKSVFSEIKRVDNITDIIRVDGVNDASKQVEQIRERLADFYEGGSLKKWLDDAYETYNFYDPNAFGVYEFVNYDRATKDIWMFPMVFRSKDVLMYEYENGDLQYLITQETIKDPLQEYDPKSKNQGRKYYRMYTTGWAYTLEEIGESTDVTTGEVYTLGKKKYLFRRYETKTEQVPAFRFGYILDATTDFNTTVPVYWSAEKLIKDLMIAKSEYDLAKFLHGFLQKYAFFPECDYKDKQNRICIGGKINNTNDTCPSCKGKGVKYHVSVQDIIIVPEPDMEETEGKYIPLNQRIHYQEIPVTIIEALKNDIKQLEDDILGSVFNSHVFSSSEVVKTAFEKGVELRSVYNTLSDYGDGYSERYMLGVRVTATHLLIKDVKTMHKFPSDFKFLSLDDLIVTRERALAARVPLDVLDAIDRNIMNKVFSDEYDAILRAEARNKYRPFREYSEAELAILTVELPENDDRKILWLYYEPIMSQIEARYPLFTVMNPAAQQEIITAVTQEYKALYLNATSAGQQGGDTAPVDDDTDDDDNMGGE